MDKVIYQLAWLSPCKNEINKLITAVFNVHT